MIMSDNISDGPSPATRDFMPLAGDCDNWDKMGMLNMAMELNDEMQNLLNLVQCHSSVNDPELKEPMSLEPCPPTT